MLHTILWWQTALTVRYLHLYHEWSALSSQGPHLTPWRPSCSHRITYKVKVCFMFWSHSTLLVLSWLPSSWVTLERLSARTVSHFCEKIAVAKVSLARSHFKAFTLLRAKTTADEGPIHLHCLTNINQSSPWAGKISTDINATFNQLLSGVH